LFILCFGDGLMCNWLLLLSCKWRCTSR